MANNHNDSIALLDFLLKIASCSWKRSDARNTELPCVGSILNLPWKGSG